jgi:hypothetical protein
VFNAPSGDLLICRREDGFLHLAHFVLHRFAPTEQIQTRPSEQTRYGIEVRTKGFATDAGGFKGNGTATAKAIPHPRRVAEGALTELLDQFRQRHRLGAKMSIDLHPCCL